MPPDLLQEPVGGRHLLLMCCTALVLAAAFVRCVVPVAPQLYWDVDPRSDRWISQITAMGPAHVAWLDVAALLVTAAALGAHLLAGGVIRWWSVVLFAAGACFCARHMPNHALDLRLGAGWIAAAALGVAARHLAEHERPRRLLIAAALGLLVPLGVDAVWYVVVEHPMTVANYRQDIRQVLEARGFQYGSAQHLLFEKRVVAADAGGAFAMSNVFGSVVAALTALAAWFGWVSLHARRRGPATVGLVAAGLGLVAVWLSRSRGAAVALCIVGATCAAVWLLRRRPRALKAVPLAAVGLVVLAVAAVLVRGMAGAPQTHEGEISLLFRFHYWQAAARIAAEPLWPGAIGGVGPARFKDDYMRLKEPQNPEQVTTSHNVFIDWVTMLGLGGVAWAALLAGWLWRGAAEGSRRLGGRSPPTDAPPVPGHRTDLSAPDMGWALLVALPLFATQYGFERYQFDLPNAMAWMVGAGGFVFVAAATQERNVAAPGHLHFALVAAALVLLVHNQIEMSFYLEGSAALAWLLVGASAATADARRGRNRWAFVVPAVVALGALILALGPAVALSRQQGSLAAAAVSLREGHVDEAVAGLRDAVATLPPDPEPYKSLAHLFLEQGRVDQVVELMDEAHRAGLDEGWRWRLLVAAARVQVERDGVKKTPAWAADAIVNLLRRNPGGIADHLHVAELHWVMGRREDAARLYARCLQLSDQARLDPARQLNAQHRQLIMRRIDEAEESPVGE